MSEILDFLKTLLRATKRLFFKLGSRKFIVLLIATHAMYMHLLPAEYWAMIAMTWQGVQGGITAIERYKQDKQPLEPDI